MSDLPVRARHETGADPTLDTPFEEQSNLQLSWRAQTDYRGLSEVHQAYVLRIIEWGDQPFFAARKVGLKSIPKGIKVNRCIAALRELRRREPLTDPRWIASKFKELHELCRDAGNLDVARKVLVDLATLEGQMPDRNAPGGAQTVKIEVITGLGSAATIEAEDADYTEVNDEQG